MQTERASAGRARGNHITWLTLRAGWTNKKPDRGARLRKGVAVGELDGYILDCEGRVRDPIFGHLLGQNRKNRRARTSRSADASEITYGYGILGMVKYSLHAVSPISA